MGQSKGGPPCRPYNAIPLTRRQRRSPPSNTAAAQAIHADYKTHVCYEGELLALIHKDGMDCILSRQNEAAAAAVSKGASTLADVQEATIPTLCRDLDPHRVDDPIREVPPPPQRPAAISHPVYDHLPVSDTEWADLHGVRVSLTGAHTDADPGTRRPGTMHVARDHTPPYIFTVDMMTTMNNMTTTSSCSADRSSWPVDIA